MPIGKLLVFPDVTSSVNFKFRSQVEEHNAENRSESESEIVELPADADGNGDLNSTSPDLQNNKRMTIHLSNDTSKTGIHPDGDHAVPDSHSYRNKSPSQSTPSLNNNPIVSSQSEGDVLVPVFLSGESFHKSYPNSETDFQPQDSSKNKNLSSSEVSRSGVVPSPRNSGNISEVNSNRGNRLEQELNELELKYVTLKREIVEKNKLIQGHETSDPELSMNRVPEDPSLQDICALMKDYVKSSQEPSKSQSVLLTTTPESNQLVIGGLAGYVGAYAIKNFGRTVCTAISGGLFLVSLGYQKGYLMFNWKKVQEDLGLSPGARGISPLVNAIELMRKSQAQIYTKYPYAFIGFLSGFGSGLLSQN